MDSAPFRQKGLMAFKIKDLMINVLPSGTEAVCGLGTCRPLTGVCDPLHAGTCACTHCSACSVCSLQCTGGCTIHQCTAACSILCTQGCTCTFCTAHCTALGATCGPCTGQCSFQCTHPATWPQITTACPQYPVGSDPEASFTALSALKEQLKQQLAEVEQQHAAAEAGLLPQSVEEADMLTKKLQEALDELKAHRAELAKKPKPAGD